MWNVEPASDPGIDLPQSIKVHLDRASVPPLFSTGRMIIPGFVLRDISPQFLILLFTTVITLIHAPELPYRKAEGDGTDQEYEI